MKVVGHPSTTLGAFRPHPSDFSCLGGDHDHRLAPGLETEICPCPETETGTFRVLRVCHVLWHLQGDLTPSPVHHLLRAQGSDTIPFGRDYGRAYHDLCSSYGVTGHGHRGHRDLPGVSDRRDRPDGRASRHGGSRDGRDPGRIPWQKNRPLRQLSVTAAVSSGTAETRLAGPQRLPPMAPLLCKKWAAPAKRHVTHC